jgi:hypothetical protein
VNGLATKAMARVGDPTLRGLAQKEREAVLMLRRISAVRRYEEFKKARRSKNKREAGTKNANEA